MRANFDANIPDMKIPIWAGHPGFSEDPPKIGNVAGLRYEPGEGLYVTPEYNEAGMDILSRGEYEYASAEVVWSNFFDTLYQKRDGEEIDNVLVAVALTNQPYFGENTAVFADLTSRRDIMADEHGNKPNVEEVEVIDASDVEAEAVPQPDTPEGFANHASDVDNLLRRQNEKLARERDQMEKRLRDMEANFSAMQQKMRFAELQARVEHFNALPDAGFVTKLVSGVNDEMVEEVFGWLAKVNELAKTNFQMQGSTEEPSSDGDPEQKLIDAMRSVADEKFSGDLNKALVYMSNKPEYATLIKEGM